MTFIYMNPDKPSFRSVAGETAGFLLSYTCVQRAYSIPATQANAKIYTLIRTQYALIIPNIFDLDLDFVGNFFHSIIQTNTYDD